MARRRANGEGTIYKRKDGRFEGAVSVTTVSGKHKRFRVYGKTHQEAHDRLADKKAANRKGIRTPDTEWTLGAYLDYWLASVVAPKNRTRTYESYESIVRLHLKPGLGRRRLTRLSVPEVQKFFNSMLAAGHSASHLQHVRSALRTALSRAVREELLVRNVAKLVDLPAWERKPIQPWSAQEASTFLAAAEPHRWYPAYAMLLHYGMRRGEVLGLRWCDIDFERNQLHIRQQLQRTRRKLEQGPVKTSAARRDPTLLAGLRDRLLRQYAKRFGCDASVEVVSERAATDESLVFLSATGTPIEPKNFFRSFQQIREQAGLRRITVHHTRHTVATLLKNLGVPARDIQMILGHAHVTTTQQLYQHADVEAQTKALNGVERLLLGGGDGSRSRQNQPML